MPAPDIIWQDGPNDSKVVAIHAALLRNGKVLIFHCRSYPMWSRLYDPFENLMSDENLVVPIWPVATETRPIEPSRIFCSGHAFLPTGELLVAGGEKTNPYPFQYLPPGDQKDRGIDYCFIFDVNNDPPWIVPIINNSPQHMEEGRWYPSLTVLSDGTVLALGGLASSLDEEHGFASIVNKFTEKFTIENGWARYENGDTVTDMPDDISYFYPAGHLIPFGAHAGKIFFTTTRIPESETQVFDPSPPNTDPPPYWTSVGGTRESPSEYSNHILLPLRLNETSSRVIVIGGLWGTALNRVDFIDLADASPEWTTIDSMTNARLYHNSIILPDRKIVVVGGVNSEGTLVNVPEFLDTDTLEWDSNTEYLAMDIPRKYHSSALLLPNAKVFLGGGRVTDGGDVEDDSERRITILKPGYLSDGAQPVIEDSPIEVTYQEQFTVVMNDNYLLDSMAFIKPMSVTHGYNSDQRYIELAFEGVFGQGDTYLVTAPDNPNIAPPGYYMLFVLKDVSESNSGLSKIPSNAVFIKLSIAT